MITGLICAQQHLSLFNYLLFLILELCASFAFRFYECSCIVGPFSIGSFELVSASYTQNECGIYTRNGFNGFNSIGPTNFAFISLLSNLFRATKRRRSLKCGGLAVRTSKDVEQGGIFAEKPAKTAKQINGYDKQNQ